MGTDLITVRNLQIIKVCLAHVLSADLLKINTEDQILTIRGHIPGPRGAWVEVTDAIKEPHRLPPPFPTHLPELQPNRPAATKKYLRLKVSFCNLIGPNFFFSTLIPTKRNVPSIGILDGLRPELLSSLLSKLLEVYWKAKTMEMATIP